MVKNGMLLPIFYNHALKGVVDMKKCGMLVLALCMGAVSAKAAQEPEIQALSPAAERELLAVVDSLREMARVLDKEYEEACENRAARHAKELEELFEQFEREDKSDEKKEKILLAFDAACEKEKSDCFNQYKQDCNKKIKESLAVKAPTLLAEDPDLKKLFHGKL
jgi:hypothetical protein